MNIIAEFDRLLHRAEVEEYTDDPVDWGRIGALREGRKLTLAYVKQRQAMDMECSRLIHQLLEENHALRVQQDEARRELEQYACEEECDDTAATVKRAIKILEELT